MKTSFIILIHEKITSVIYSLSIYFKISKELSYYSLRPFKILNHNLIYTINKVIRILE